MAEEFSVKYIVDELQDKKNRDDEGTVTDGDDGVSECDRKGTVSRGRTFMSHEVEEEMQEKKLRG